MSIFSTGRAWQEFGRSYARWPKLWDSSCVLATLGPQPDKGTVARDLTGRGYQGTLTGATHLPTWSNWSHRGQQFRGLTCDGTEDCVTITDAASLNFGDATNDFPFTFCSWANVTGVTVGHSCPMVSKGATTSASGLDYNFSYGWDQNLYIVLYDNSGTNYIYRATNTAPLVLGSWHCYVTTYTGSKSSAGLSLFIDGVTPATATGSSGSYTAMHGAAQSLRLGAFVPADAAKEFMKGSVASAFAWRRVLTQAEISILARHPLAPYEVRLPEYFYGVSTTTTDGYRWWLPESQMVGGMHA